MIGKVTYHQQVSYCGKPRCKKCREGTGHGPYWYAYQTIDGRTSRTYVGKTLPQEALETIEGSQPPTPVHQSELEQQKATIRIYTLGQFRLERRSSPSDPEWHTVTEAAWQHQRVRALLGCLLTHPGRKLGREQIMDFLWPDLDLDMAASRLDRSVYSLRQLFEPARSKLAASPLVLTEREVLALADQLDIWVDADAFDHLLTHARDTSDLGTKEKLLEEAMLLYGGDFLPEALKIEWTRPRRESLLRAWVGLLLELSDLRSERESYSASIEPLDKLLSIDPANEAAVQRLMLRLGILGRRGEALRAYRKLASVLQQEYHISPLPDTRAIYEKVRGGQAATDGDSSTAGVKPRLQPASQAAPRTDAPATIQIGRSHQSPLVGREQELSLLRDLVTTTEQAAKFKLPGAKKTSMLALDTQRRPQCILLMGEVGIGKTRLAEEVSRDAKRRNWAVAWSRVYSQEGSIPYRLWTEVLRKAMEQGAWQRQEVSKRSLVFQPLSTLLPDVLQPLLVPIAFSSALPPEQEQLRLWEAACELLKLISESTPLLIALDDLQWADASSCELLAYLSRRVQGYPIVIVGTCRENEMAASHPLRSLLTDLQREHSVECVSLEPLSDEHIDSLVSSIKVPPALVKRIRNRAAGNPFFAEELARTLPTPEEVSRVGSPFVAPTDLANIDGSYQLPETISAVLDLRLARLTLPCQRMLSKAAVLGGSFEFNIISTMEAMTPGSDEDVVLDLLEEALKSGMLAEQGTGTRITYEFWHPLLVTHLYEKLSAARRASLHRRAAEILLRVYKDHEEEEAATITYHLVGGGADSLIIAKYAEMAGDHAYSLSSYPESEQYYQLAMEHLEAPFQRQAPLDREKQLHLAYLLECLGECTRFQGKDEEARHFYERVLAVRNSKYVTGQAVDMQREAQLDALLWCAVGWTWYNIGNNVEALHCYERGMQVLEIVGVIDGPAWANIRLQQSYVSWREGNYDDAQIKASAALELFEDTLDQWKDRVRDTKRLSRIGRTLIGDPVDLGRTHVLLGLISNGMGRSADALFHLNTALALYEQYDSLREIAIVCCDLGDVHLRRGEYLLAQAVLRRSLSLAERIGELPLVSLVYGNLGILDIRTGNLLESEIEFRQAIGLANKADDPVITSVFYTYLAITLQEQGKLSEMMGTLRRALAISRTTRIKPCIGLALVALGNMRISQTMAISISLKNYADEDKTKKKFLERAKKTLKRTLAFEGIEAETRNEGQLALAQVALLMGDLEEAQLQVKQALEEARKSELMWLVARAYQLSGCIESELKQIDQASQHFEMALRIFRKSDMRLEQARTQRLYGMMLIEQGNTGGKGYQQGLSYLQDALRVFVECKAELDRELAERFLIKHNCALAK